MRADALIDLLATSWKTEIALQGRKISSLASTRIGARSTARVIMRYVRGLLKIETSVGAVGARSNDCYH